KKLQDQTRDRKVSLEAALRGNQPISEADEDWLDNSGNLVDEECLIEKLAVAQDYEMAITSLDSQEQSMIQRLKEAAGWDVVPSKKRKLSGANSVADGERKRAQPQELVKKQNATLEQRIDILDWHHKNGKNQTKTAMHFDKIYPALRLKQPKISEWLKQEVAWRAEYETA
ncbi:hypothetical protein L210DRAFT_793783, partial [Boletus edulis BED1]